MAQPQLLIAGPEPQVLQALQQDLANLGYGVATVAPTVAAVREYAARASVDLLLWDLGKNGEQEPLATELRVSGRFPVVWLLADEDAATLRLLGLKRSFEYLLKPWDRRQLRTIVEMALERYRLRRTLAQARRKGPREEEGPREAALSDPEALQQEIAARRRVEETLRAANRFLAIANRHHRMQGLLQEFVREVRDFTGCQAVAVRIRREEGKIPYEAQEGFPPEFIARESPLSILFHRCLCINVMTGATDPRLPCYTEGSSCYINNFSELLATVPPEVRGPTRNVCHEFGFESVALMPIMLGDSILGLIHVADPRLDMVPLEKVQVLEKVAIQLGTALQRVTVEEALRQAEEERGALLQQVQDFSEELQAGNEELQATNEELHAQAEELQRLTADLEAQRRFLEAANKELEAFSYSVSHDLRAPLRAIGGFARILADEYGSRLDAEGRRLLEVIRTNGRTMGNLIDDLLTLSRLGRKELKKWRLDLDAMTHSIFKELQAQEPERRLQLNLQPLPPARGDRTLMNQVLVNLLSNAVKFTRLREKALIEVGGWTEEKEYIYYVGDNGVGFDMQYADKLFGVFQRLHRREDFEGTGVGLAIVLRIIQRHGGRVWATGKEEKGATFYFSLPCQGENM